MVSCLPTTRRVKPTAQTSTRFFSSKPTPLPYKFWSYKASLGIGGVWGWMGPLLAPHPHLQSPLSTAKLIIYFPKLPSICTFRHHHQSCSPSYPSSSPRSMSQGWQNPRLPPTALAGSKGRGQLQESSPSTYTVPTHLSGPLTAGVPPESCRPGLGFVSPLGPKEGCLL